jgi:hypothetical protein
MYNIYIYDVCMFSSPKKHHVSFMFHPKFPKKNEGTTTQAAQAVPEPGPASPAPPEEPLET